MTVGIPTLAARCVHSRRGNGHFWKPLPNFLYDRKDELQKFFAGEIFEDEESCFVVNQNRSRATICGKSVNKSFNKSFTKVN